MARVRNNIFVRGLIGSFGEQFVVRHDKAGRTIVSVSPVFDEGRTYTEAQLSWQEKFREASSYAKEAKDNEAYVKKAVDTPMNPYNVALADWLHEPEILEMDMSAWHGQAGNVIRVKAIDDVQVTQVSVVITDSGGEVLEQGQAVRGQDVWWSYTMTTHTPGASFVVTTARDLPAHIAQMKWEDGVGMVK